MTEPYHYLNSGLPNVWLHGVVVHTTPYGRGTSIPAVEELHRAIGIAITESNRKMTGPEVRFLRTELDLSQRLLAGLLDVQENTLRRWELGETRIPGPAQRALAGYYLETVKEGGRLRDLMHTLAAADRKLADLDLRFERRGDTWTQRAA